MELVPFLQTPSPARHDDPFSFFVQLSSAQSWVLFCSLIQLGMLCYALLCSPFFFRMDQLRDINEARSMPVSSSSSSSSCEYWLRLSSPSLYSRSAGEWRRWWVLNAGQEERERRDQKKRGGGRENEMERKGNRDLQPAINWRYNGSERFIRAAVASCRIIYSSRWGPSGRVPIYLDYALLRWHYLYSSAIYNTGRDDCSSLFTNCSAPFTPYETKTKTAILACELKL